MRTDEMEIIAQYIELDPYHPGPGDVRLVPSAVPVWAIVAHLATVGGDTSRAAADYEISEEEVQAAEAYYRANRAVLDARLAANAASAVIRPSGVPA